MRGMLTGRANSLAVRSPFQPGRGKLPPCLAGREQEQALIRKFLEILSQSDAPPSDIVIFESTCDRMLELGHLWPVIEDDVILDEPGIPSLMRFVSRN